MGFKSFCIPWCSRLSRRLRGYWAQGSQSSGPVEEEADIAVLQEFETASMLLHGELTDSKNTHMIRFLLDKIRETGSLAGLVTHRPLQTLSWLDKARLKFDMIMVPLNRAGLFMDADAGEIVKVLKHLGKPVIAKKTLAAGYPQPEEALRYVADLEYIEIVTIGIASQEKAEETFPVALECFH